MSQERLQERMNTRFGGKVDLEKVLQTEAGGAPLLLDKIEHGVKIEQARGLVVYTEDDVRELIDRLESCLST